MSCVYTHTHIYIYANIHIYTYIHIPSGGCGRGAARTQSGMTHQAQATGNKQFGNDFESRAARSQSGMTHQAQTTGNKQFGNDFTISECALSNPVKKQTNLQTNINISAIDFRIVSTHANKSRNDIRILTSSIMLARNSRPQLPIREDKDVFVLLDVYQLLFNFEGDA